MRKVARSTGSNVAAKMASDKQAQRDQRAASKASRTGIGKAAGDAFTKHSSNVAAKTASDQVARQERVAERKASAPARRAALKASGMTAAEAFQKRDTQAKKDQRTARVAASRAKLPGRLEKIAERKAAGTTAGKEFQKRMKAERRAKSARGQMDRIQGALGAGGGGMKSGGMAKTKKV